MFLVSCSKRDRVDWQSMALAELEEIQQTPDGKERGKIEWKLFTEVEEAQTSFMERVCPYLQNKNSAPVAHELLQRTSHDVNEWRIAEIWHTVWSGVRDALRNNPGSINKRSLEETLWFNIRSKDGKERTTEELLEEAAKEAIRPIDIELVGRDWHSISFYITAVGTVACYRGSLTIQEAMEAVEAVKDTRMIPCRNTKDGKTMLLYVAIDEYSSAEATKEFVLSLLSLSLEDIKIRVHFLLDSFPRFVDPGTVDYERRVVIIHNM